MLFSELLKAQGLSEVQIKAIVKDMRSNKIFITYEEKIEERYQKMKHQRDSLRTILGLVEKAIEKEKEPIMNYRLKGEGVKMKHDQ